MVLAVAPEAIAVVAAFAAERCRQCYQCGQCVAGCPSGWDLDHGPRRVVRLILAGDVQELLRCEDVWRCSECGHCTESCPMEVDTAAAMALVRDLQRRFGGVRCPERTAAEIATRRLGRRARIDNIAFGAAMISRGNVPRDLAGSVAQGTASAHSLAARTRARLAGRVHTAHRWPLPEQRAPGAPAGRVAGDARAVLAWPFFAGCARPQDVEAYTLTRQVAADLAVRLEEQPSAGCCGHPTRGAHPASYRTDGVTTTVCPACDASLTQAGQETRPLWEMLVEQAHREGRRLRALAPAFVPYVGCLGERERALDSLAAAAELAAAEMRRSFPSLHASCCGALGGMFRGDTHASRRLLRFAAAGGSPVVTTCLLCRDNLRSAARLNRLAVPVYLWPEFFQATESQATERTEAP